MTHTRVQHVLFFPQVRDSTKFLLAAAHMDNERYIYSSTYVSKIHSGAILPESSKLSIHKAAWTNISNLQQ